MIRLIRKDINEIIVPAIKQIEPQYTADAGWIDILSNAISTVLFKWSSPQFQAVAAQIASQFVQTSNSKTRKAFNGDVKRIGLDIYGDSPELQNYIDAAIYDNTQLIKSIPSQYLERVQSIVTTNTRAGLRPSSIVKVLQDQFDITENRAKLIARDQTSKLAGDLAEKRQREAGFPYFEWNDSDDQRVRHRHEEIANRVTAYGKGIYSWSDLPLSDTGKPIKPGSDYQCRCFARPVSQREVDENRKAGRTNPAVKR